MDNNQTIYYGGLIGFIFSLKTIKYRDIFKGNTAVFGFSFQGRLVKVFTLSSIDPGQILQLGTIFLLT